MRTAASSSGQDARADYAAASRLPTAYVFPQRAESLPVLARAVAVNPDDATAHFLLGSLYLSGGLTGRALAEWDAALRLDPKRPVLHRNVGLTLLYSGGDLEKARAVLAQGLEADPANPQVYLALDQALELVGRPAAERAAALRRYPDPERLPSALVLKLALVLAEDGRFDEAESLVPRALLPARGVRDERPRRLARGPARAGAGRPHARATRARRSRSQSRSPGRSKIFRSRRTASAPSSTSRASSTASASSTRSATRRRGLARAWTKAAAAGDGFPFLGPVYAWRAARRLGPVDEAQWRDRLQSSLEAIDTRLVVGTNYPGLLAAARGLTLESLGRGAEARAEIDRALLLPDKRLAHRIALETEKPLPKEASR